MRFAGDRARSLWLFTPRCSRRSSSPRGQGWSRDRDRPARRPGSTRRATSAASRPAASSTRRPAPATSASACTSWTSCSPPAGATTATPATRSSTATCPSTTSKGPQICTQAKELKPEVIRGKDFVAVKLQFTFTKPAKGFKAGSTWEQTLVFQPGVRYVLSSEQITSVNDVDDLFYRIDMPGHVKHKDGDTFDSVYLSYLDKPIPAAEFKDDFAPDDKFLYQRDDGKIPERMIRAYQVKVDGKPGPWLAGHDARPGGGRPRRGATSAATSASSRSCTSGR